MSYNNTVAIISNADFTVQEIKSMLVLLREIDKVECCNYYDAEETIKKTLPNVVILHSSENNKECLRLLKKLRKDERTKDIPVILYSEYSSTDFIVEAFDSGMTDILTAPLQDFELVIRVIWAIQKSETALIRRTKDDFLAKLGIIDERTGFYKENFGIKYLESIIAKSRTSKQKSCLLMVKIQQTIGTEANKELIANSLKSSIRLNDAIAAKDSNTYYIFLSKAKLNGVYSVYERLLSRIGLTISMNACVIEIHDEIFDDIINVLDYKISKAPNNGEIAVISKQDFIDMYEQQEAKEKSEEREELGIARLLTSRELDEIKETPREPKLKPLHKKEKQEPKEDDLSLGLKIMQEKVQEIQTEQLKASSSKKLSEEKDVDERNAVLYKQAYAKKLTMVIEPLLKKYAGKLQSEYAILDANVEVSPNFTFLKLDKNDVELNFEITYSGLKNVRFNLAITALGTDIESDSFEMEVTEFDYQKLDIILKTITDEYRNYISD